jgi:AmmeMemoRadiSam system protein A
MPPPDAGPVVLAIARAAIARALGLSQTTKTDESAPWLQQPGACFVTLMQGSRLRGCIGTLEVRRSLLDDVRANAVAAAMHDPRFAPLTAPELARTDMEVSLLSTAEPLAFASEAEALAQLRPGVDGVVFAFGSHRSTFLPQVWEQLPRVEAFMSQLKQKAGLGADFWADGVRLSRYTVTKWKEAAPVALT